MGHAGGQAADREHFLRLHHHFFQRQALGDVVDTDNHATAGATHQRVEGQGVVAGDVVLGPGDAFDLGHAVSLDRVAQLRQEGLEGLECQVDRLVQRFIQGRAG
ncbi:hypothetical protein D3C85_1290980 [compost metagenome]